MAEGQIGSEHAFREWGRDAVTEKVEAARRASANQGLSFLGAMAVMAASFLQRATSSEKKRGINPRLAARDVLVRVTFLAVERAFQTAYRAALERWRTRDRAALFPFGTWWFGVHHRAEVAPTPT